MNAINNCIIFDPKITSDIFYPPFTIINDTRARNESIRDIDSNSGNLNNLHFAVEVSTTAIDIPITRIFIQKPAKKGPMLMHLLPEKLYPMGRICSQAMKK